jgi:hypothetical protein
MCASRFVAFARGFGSFHVLLAHLTEQAGEASSLLKRHATGRKVELMTLRDNLMVTIEELMDLHQRYERNVGAAWTKVTKVRNRPS